MAIWVREGRRRGKDRRSVLVRKGWVGRRQRVGKRWRWCEGWEMAKEKSISRFIANVYKVKCGGGYRGEAVKEMRGRQQVEVAGR